MTLFGVGQIWVSLDGKRHAEVVEVADLGWMATVVITNANGNFLTRADVNAQFQERARLVREKP